MKISPKTLRLLALPALAFMGVSCGSKDDPNANPYASNPYYGPQTYGNSGQGAPADTAGQYADNSYVAPAPAPDYGSTGYIAPPPAAPAPAPIAPSYGSTGGNTAHTVAAGDTLFSLSRRYGTSVTAIKSANGLNSDLIRIGQNLTIPM